MLQQFFDKLGPVIGSNCTIGGVLWSESMSKSSKTASSYFPFLLLHSLSLPQTHSLRRGVTRNDELMVCGTVQRRSRSRRSFMNEF